MHLYKMSLDKYPSRIHVGFIHREPTVKERFVERQVLVFAGQDERVKEILQKKDMSAKDHEFLEKRFGKDYREVLAFPLKKGGGEDPFGFSDIFQNQEIVSIQKKEVIDKKKAIEVSKEPLKYIFQDIGNSDTIEELRDKIALASGIPSDYQHLAFIENGKFKPLDYELDYDNMTPYPGKYEVDITRAYYDNPQVKIVHEKIPIDMTLVSILTTRKAAALTCKGRMLYDAKEIAPMHDLYLVDLRDFIGDIPQSTMEEILETRAEFEDFYYGFIKKFFPYLTEGAFKMVLRGKWIEKYNSGLSDVRIALDALDKATFILDKITPGKKILDEEVNLGNLVININHPGERALEDIADPGRILSFRNLFDFLPASEQIPYMKFRADSGIIWSKAFLPFYLENVDGKIKDWNSTTPKGMTIKFELGGKIHNMVLYQDGKLDCQASWTRNERKTDVEINTFIDRIQSVISTINNLNPLVFPQRVRIKEVSPNKSNVTIVSVNIFIFFPGVFLDPGLYKRICDKFFGPFVQVDSAGKTKIEARFIRVSTTKFCSIVMSDKRRDKTKYDRNITMFNSFEEDGSPLLKIIVDGIKSLYEKDVIVDFLKRSVSACLEGTGIPEIEEIKKGREGAVNIEALRQKQFKKKEKNIGKLQEADLRLFGYSKFKKISRNEKKSRTFKEYSRVCQKKQYPTPYTEEELAKLPKGSYTYALPYSNKTNPNGAPIIYYVCKHGKHVYPGFVSPARHPEGFCLPCCRLMSSIDGSRPQNEKLLKSCLKDDLGRLSEDKLKKELKKAIGTLGMDITESAIKSADRDASIADIARKSKDINLNEILEGIGKYIKQYARTLYENRLSHLPPSLGRILTTAKCRINRIKVLARGAECFVIFGTRRGPRAFLNSVGICLANSFEWGEHFLKAGIEELKRKPELFKLLENGTLEKKYQGGWSDYVAKISNPERVIDENEVIDLLRLALPLLNILVFAEDSSGNFSLNCRYDASKLKKEIENENAMTIMMVKRYRAGVYNPIFLARNLQVKKRASSFSSSPPPGLRSFLSAPMETTGGAMEVEELEKILVANIDDGIYAMDKIFNWKDHREAMEKVSRLILYAKVETSKEKEEFRRRFNLEKVYNLVDIYRNLSNEFEVEAQVENSWGLISGLLVEGVVFPINLSQSKKVGKNYKLVRDKNAGFPSLDHFLKIHGKIMKSNRIAEDVKAGYELEKVLINGKGNMIGFETMAKFRFFIKEQPRGKGYEKMEVVMHDFFPWDVNEAIKTDDKKEDERIREMRVINYDMEIYHLLRIEIAEEINSEKNDEVRRQLKKLLGELKGKDLDGKREIRGKIRKLMSRKDYNKVKELIETEREGDLDVARFDFDFETRRKLGGLISLGEEKKVRKMLMELAEKRVAIVPSVDDEDVGRVNIRDSCSEKKKGSVSFCSWDAKRGRMVLGLKSKKRLEELVDRIVNEVINNDTKKLELLHGMIKRVGDPDEFISRGDEVIMKS